MSTYMNDKPGTLEKVVYWVLAMLVLATLTYLPFAVSNRQRQAEESWQDSGCQMYDNEVLSNVPAKCLNAFADHYRPQQRRHQPNQE